MRLLLYVFVMLNSFQHPIHAQNKQIDSLKTRLNQSVSDSERVKSLFEISLIFDKTDAFDSALNYLDSAQLMLEEKIRPVKKDVESSFYKNYLAKVNIRRGVIFRKKGIYPEAIKFSLLSLKLCEETRNKSDACKAYSNLGICFTAINSYNDAHKYLSEGLRLAIEINDTKQQAAIYNNIGQVYRDQKKYKEAIENYTQALEINKKTGNAKWEAYNLLNIGSVYMKQNEYPKAFKIAKATLKICQELDDKVCVAGSNECLGRICLIQKNYPDAELYLLKALKISSEIGYMETMCEVRLVLSNLYNETGKPEKSLFHYKRYISLRDSMINEENTKKTVRLEMNYEFDKKEAAAKLDQEKKEAVAAAESKKQRIVLILVSCVLVLVFVFAVFAYRSFIQKKKANIAITAQKQIIEEKQREILDSIVYARRIQRSLLTNEIYIEKTIKRLKNA